MTTFECEEHVRWPTRTVLTSTLVQDRRDPREKFLACRLFSLSSQMHTCTKSEILPAGSFSHFLSFKCLVNVSHPSALFVRNKINWTKVNKRKIRERLPLQLKTSKIVSKMFCSCVLQPKFCKRLLNRTLWTNGPTPTEPEAVSDSPKCCFLPNSRVQVLKLTAFCPTGGLR